MRNTTLSWEVGSVVASVVSGLSWFGMSAEVAREVFAGGLGNGLVMDTASAAEVVLGAWVTDAVDADVVCSALPAGEYINKGPVYPVPLETTMEDPVLEEGSRIQFVVELVMNAVESKISSSCVASGWPSGSR